MDDTVDLLQIKIDKAKRELSEDTLSAINAVPWQAAILKMRETKGFTFEQLGNLETETELVLCGLLPPADYPKELEKRMNISQPAANQLVLEMNKEVFSRIKEELIKITERKKISTREEAEPIEIKMVKPNIIPQDTEEDKKIHAQIFQEHGIKIHPARNEFHSGGEPDLTIPELEAGEKEIHPIVAQKLSGSFQIPSTKTEHTLENITKTSAPAPANAKVDKPRMDPYREIPE